MENEDIKCFSGTDNYNTGFELTEVEAKQLLSIGFERISAIAIVKLNGKELGIHWTTPYRIDISTAAKLGINELEVKVSNNWVSQLLWQTKKPVEKRDTWQLVHALEKMPNDGILPSGIWGKVWISTENNK